MKFKITKSTSGYIVSVSYSEFNPFASHNVYEVLSWNLKGDKRVFSRNGHYSEVDNKRIAMDVIKSYIRSRVTIIVEGEEELDL